MILCATIFYYVYKVRRKYNKTRDTSERYIVKNVLLLDWTKQNLNITLNLYIMQF